MSTHKPGDVVNGFVLTEDGVWLRLNESSPSPSDTGPASPRSSGSLLSRASGAVMRFGLRRLFVSAVSLLLAFGFLPGALRSAWHAWNNGGFGSAPAIAQEDADAIELLGIELWEGRRGTSYVLHLSAKDLAHDFVGASYEIDVLAEDGTVLGTGEGYAGVSKDRPVMSMGTIEPTPGADPFKDGVSFSTRAEVHLGVQENPGLEIESVEIVAEQPGDYTAEVTVSAVTDSRAGGIAILLRDADGTILGGSTAVTGQVRADRGKVISITLWDIDEELPEGYTYEAVVIPR